LNAIDVEMMMMIMLETEVNQVNIILSHFYVIVATFHPASHFI
jgi:hypothetical protein